jgi:hypothetical protein
MVSRKLAPVLLLSLLLPGLPAAPAADDPRPRESTPRGVAERVLRPYLASLQDARAALSHYEEQNGIAMKAVRLRIQELRDTRHVYDKKLREETAASRQLVRWTEEARDEIRTDHQRMIRHLRERAEQLRSEGDERDAAEVEKRADQLLVELRLGRASGVKKELGDRPRTLKELETLGGDEGRRMDRRREQYRAGKVPLPHRCLRDRHHTWEQIQGLIAEERKVLASLERRERGYVLEPFRRGMTGEQIDAHLATVRRELEDARQRIRDGTFVVEVPSLGNRRACRNTVLRMIAEAEEGLREVEKAWAEKRWVAQNPKRGQTLSNGDIEQRMVLIRKAIADFRARGDEAGVFVEERGGMLTGAVCRERQRLARAADDDAGAAYWAKMHAAWKKACQKRVDGWNEENRYWQECLEAHECLWDEVRAKRQEHIDLLKRALDETPAGGTPAVDGDPLRALVEDHLRQLHARSESDEESRRRRADYEDVVYVDADGFVHGSPEEAWARALHDTGARDPSLVKTGAEAVAELKNLVDWVGGHVGLHEMDEASEALDEFIRAFAALDPDAPDFIAVRDRLHGRYFAKIRALLTTGILSRERIEKLIAANRGLDTDAARAVGQRLQQLLATSHDLRRTWLPRWNQILTTLGRMGADTRATVTGVLNQSVGQLRSNLGDKFRKMSGMEKGLLVLGVAAAVAEAAEKIDGGMAVPEAAARSGVNLTIDLLIAGIPLLAAAEIVSQITLGTARYVTEDEAYGDATLSNIAKALAGLAFDEVAEGAAWLQQQSLAIHQPEWDERKIASLLRNVDPGKLRRSLAAVERRLDGLSPGHPDEARLLRIRGTLRRLLRAKA